MRIVCAALVLAVIAGCSTTPEAEKAPSGTIAYYVKVESSEPGVTIQTNGVDAGKTPLRLGIFGTKNGLFHNFGAPQYTVSALPLRTNQFLQTQVFSTGSKSAPGAKIPGLIFFNLDRRGGSFSLDTLPDN